MEARSCEGNTHENANESESEEDMEMIYVLEDIIKFADAAEIMGTGPKVKTLKALVRRNLLSWLINTAKEINVRLKLGKEGYQQIRDELAKLKDVCEEVMLTFEYADRQDWISLMTQIELQTENVEESRKAAKKMLHFIIIKLISDLLLME